jgi:hypothetical protein
MQPSGMLPSLDGPAAFQSCTVKASSFASHPFEWFALSELLFFNRMVVAVFLFLFLLIRLTRYFMIIF